MPPPPPSALHVPPPPVYQGHDGGVAGKPLRPQVRAGASLLMGGAIVLCLAVFLPWFKIQGETWNGRHDFITSKMEVIAAPGNFWLFLGAVLFGLGLASYLAGRNLAVAIIAVVMSVITLFFSLIGIGAAQSTKDFMGEGTVGIGAIVGILAAFVALSGSITVLAKRRR